MNCYGTPVRFPKCEKRGFIRGFSPLFESFTRVRDKTQHSGQRIYPQPVPLVSSSKNAPERLKRYRFTDQSYVEHKIVIPNILAFKLENKLGICSQWGRARLRPRRKPHCPCHRGRWAQRCGRGGARKYARQNRCVACCRCRWPCWATYPRRLSRASHRGGGHPQRLFAP